MQDDVKLSTGWRVDDQANPSRFFSKTFKKIQAHEFSNIVSEEFDEIGDITALDCLKQYLSDEFI